MGLNLSMLLAEPVRRDPGRTALLLGDGRRVSYAELATEVERVSAGLAAAGVGPGIVVGLLLPNGPEFVAAYLATVRIGGVALPLNPALRAGEIEHCLADSGALVLLLDPAAAVEEQEGVHTAVAAAGVETTVIVGGPEDAADQTYDRLRSADHPAAEPAATAADDVAVLLYTSGTTGRPKGARLTHSGLAWIAEVLATRIFRLTPDDVVYCGLPLSHIFGLNALLDATLLSGATLVLEPRFEPDRALGLAAEYGVTVFPGVPAMAIGLLAAHRRRPVALPALRVALLGGQSAPPDVMREFGDTFGCHLIESYGISEMSSAVAATPSDRAGKPGSVGEPVWGTEVRIGSADGGLAPGERGEILVRGPGVMAGYHGMPEQSADALRGGWLHTGDIGYLDADGDLFVVDRLKEVIIRGGYNVYPREVEDVLYAHPDVQQAAVVGVPDDEHGEEVAAAVTLREGATVSAEELREFVRARLAGYKYPRIVALVDVLPTSSTGKLLKRELDPGWLRAVASAQAGASPPAP